MTSESFLRTTKFVFEGLKGGGRSRLLGGGESSSGGDKGGKDGRLHFDFLYVKFVRPEGIYRDDEKANCCRIFASRIAPMRTLCTERGMRVQQL